MSAVDLPAEIVDALRRAPRLAVLLDYDGTLVPLAGTPDLAAPDADLLDLLAALAARPATDLHIVSGRPRASLDRWFGHLPVALWAEHGFFRRAAARGDWVPAALIPADWRNQVQPIFEHFTAMTPGSFIEPKDASMAWHFRGGGEAGERHAREMRAALDGIVEGQGLELLEGQKVVEVRQLGYHKGLAAGKVSLDAPGAAILAIGDDHTDEDLFRALPEGSVTIAVGTRPSAARYRAPDAGAVRALLRSLI